VIDGEMGWGGNEGLSVGVEGVEGEGCVGDVIR